MSGNRSKRRLMLELSTRDANLAKLVKMFPQRTDAGQFDLKTDVNEEFFASAYYLVETIAKTVDKFIAQKLKTYVDLLWRIHGQFVSDNNKLLTMKDKVKVADEKLRLALETTAASDAMMQHFEESLADAWRIADVAQENEAIAKHVCATAIQNKHSVGLGPRAEDMASSKDVRILALVMRERDRLALEQADYEKRLETQRNYSSTLERLCEVKSETISKLQAHIKVNDVDRITMENKHIIELKKNEDIINDLHKSVQMLTARNHTLHGFEAQYLHWKKEHSRLHQMCDSLTKAAYVHRQSMQKIEGEKSHLQLKVKLLENKTDALTQLNQEKDLHIQAIVNTNKKQSTDLMMQKSKIQQFNRRNAAIQKETDTLKHTNLVLEKKLLFCMSEQNRQVNQINTILKSKEKIGLEIVRLNDVISTMHHDIVLRDNEKARSKLDMHKVIKTLQETENKLTKAINEKNNAQHDVNDLHEVIEQLEDEHQIRLARIRSLKEQLETKERAYFTQRTRSEKFQSENAILQKKLDVCMQDRNHLQLINTKMAHQISQLTHTVSGNENESAGLKMRIDHLNSIIKQKTTELQTQNYRLNKTRDELKDWKIRYEHAQQTIDADVKRFKEVCNSMNDLHKEKNLVGHQMVRRNDELRLLKIENDMMHMALKQGSAHYNKRIEDIRLLKLEVLNLRSSQECMRRVCESTISMRQELVRKERQLNIERLKATALNDLVSNPCRIHRWRVLLGKDPKKYDLIRKIQTLLKRNLRLSVHRDSLQKQLEEAHRMYALLKRQVKYVPSPNIQHELFMQKRINHRQLRKLKACKAELAINEMDLNAQSCMISEYKRSLFNVSFMSQYQKDKHSTEACYKSYFEDVRKTEAEECEDDMHLNPENDSNRNSVEAYANGGIDGENESENQDENKVEKYMSDSALHL